jgi:lipopolysaccharide assembly protein B
MRRWLWRRRPAPTVVEASAQIREALRCVLGGDLARAEVVLAEAARVDSSSADVYLALANLYRARGEIGRAIQIHQNLLLRQELPVALQREALLGLALDFRRGGFLRRAAASFGELLEAEPRHPEALRELERLRVELGDWEGALELRRRIGSSDPRTPRVRAHLWTGLGRAHLAAGRAREAQKAFRRALASDRTCAEAYVAHGDLRLQEDEPRKAISLWERALPLHPAAGSLLYPKLWAAHERLGTLAAFEQVLAERASSAPDDRDAPLWRSRALVKLGRVDEALGVLQQLRSVAPDFLPAHAETGRVLLQVGRERELQKVFEELLPRLPPQALRLRCRSCHTLDHELRWRCPQCGEWDPSG